MSFFAITRTTLEKDICLEWRSKDAINAMLFFALLVVVIFSFAFDPTAEESRRIAGDLCWGCAIRRSPERLSSKLRLICDLCPSPCVS